MASIHHRDESGASSIEYGLIVFAIAALIAAVVFLLGGVVREAYDNSCDIFAGTAADNDVITQSNCDVG